MKRLYSKTIFIVLLIVLSVGLVYATEFGISPGKVDFGKVEPGKIYEKDITVVNNKNDVSIKFFSNSVNVNTEQENYKLKSGRNNVKLILNVKDCVKKKNEDIIIASTDSDLDAGIGLKVLYEIQGECENKITGLTIAGTAGKVKYDKYILYGFFGFVVFIFLFRKIVKRIRK